MGLTKCIAHVGMTMQLQRNMDQTAEYDEIMKVKYCVQLDYI